MAGGEVVTTTNYQKHKEECEGWIGPISIIITNHGMRDYVGFFYI